MDRDGALKGIVSLDDLLIAMSRTVTGIAHEMSDVAQALNAEFLHEHALAVHALAVGEHRDRRLYDSHGIAMRNHENGVGKRLAQSLDRLRAITHGVALGPF